MKHFNLINAILILFSLNSVIAQSKIDISEKEARLLSKEAFEFGFPAVFIENQFYVNSYVTKPEGLKAPINQFAHSREFVDASNRQYVGNNVDVLASLASIDLSEEALVITIPEMGDRFWLMQLINTWNEVPAVPSSRTHGGEPRTFLVAGPKWEGNVPDNMELLRANTETTLIVLRLYCSGKEEYKEVNAIQDQIKITPLNQWGKNYEAPSHVALKENFDGNRDVDEIVMSLTPEEFFNALNKILVNNPPYEEDQPFMEKISKLGIIPGEEFNYNNYSEEVKEAITFGVADAKHAIAQRVKNLGQLKNNWILTYDMGRFGTDYNYRAAWSLIGVGGNLLEDAFYPTTIIDEDGEMFDTNKYAYKITFTKEELPPVASFWSLTMYDIQSYLVDNELNKYTVGDRSNLTYNEDGSLTIYMQKDRPTEDKVTNWLPAPIGPFRIALRLYTPKEQVVNGSWIPPVVQKIK
ncbi:DUF1214 domain-containing protein [Flammeovirga yaeyamensis]|uniref:DUF1214 domain-containing protein n=1 Tax=Flammeovirga yaeyamensis TaxID=367791 RepID=A0AAX1ND43_9BACT|nr:DUF1254 domain-containing protein [Flammeovirga yaeyamensis]MBB3699443.1 hypothetical protein [Flammeovirga yaeyamensis]NMF35300.1 DUF1254 domain-containing protein [Flammeovirga yaeyamensis]QWG04160.1 DUF1214 domain-containing protein [Flammeovirga yaeyamensis]